MTTNNPQQPHTPLTDAQRAREEIMKDVQRELDGTIDFQKVRVEDVIHLTARLAQVLAEEADLLEQMQITRVGELQKEKTMLTHALELMKKQLMKQPEALEEIDAQTRDDLQEVIAVFNQILEENYRRLDVARRVNQRVVEAVTDVIAEQNKREGYDQKGQSGGHHDQALSVTLNEKV